MKLDEIVSWYQKKIGTYDKQEWERTVEQKILDGFSGVTLKTAKLKTEFIDVDLVRGSTFPKAKPKQTLLTVIRLAVLRYLFLPIYAKWWVKQTSPNVFVILLLLYITQMINWAIYTYHVDRNENYSIDCVSNASEQEISDTNSTLITNQVHIITLPDLLIPMALSLLLSLIHSQIVATNTASGAKVQCRRFSNASQSGKPSQREPSRLRRRKKLIKIRSVDNNDTHSAHQQQQKRKPLATQLSHSGVEVITKIQMNAPMEDGNLKEEAFNSTTSIRCSPYRDVATPAKLNLELNSAAAQSHCNDRHNENPAMNRKRNVNWNFESETQEKQQQTSPQQLSSTTTTTATNSSQASTPSNAADSDAASASPKAVNAAGNSSSSSGSGSSNKSVRIDESVQEFYDDLVYITDHNLSRAAKRAVGEDDGFESLNGKSSSGEEMPHTALPTTTVTVMAAMVPGQQHLRMRMNAGDSTSKSIEAEETKAPIVYRRQLTPLSEADYEKKTKKMHSRAQQSSTEETEEEGDDGEVGSSPASVGNNLNYIECTPSATEWLGVTTNSEECSYSSELENTDEYKNNHMTDEDGYDHDFTPTTILNSHGANDRISCTIWAHREVKKATMSVLEISSCIIDRVESMPETNDYIYIGVAFSLILSLIPTFCRLCEVTLDADKSNEINYLEVPMLLWEKASFSLPTIFGFAFGHTNWERIVLIIGMIERLCLTTILFIIFAVAERTFKQRFLYAKLFSHLTSSRRARKSNLPHFRLNKVRNIKTWLSVRSYLKKRGPQRSVDVIVSAAFMVTLLLLAFLSVEWLKDSVHMHSHLNLEALLWSTTIGIFLIRFMTLGNKIHSKYRSISVLITEQINLYLQIEQKPKKKDELMVSNSVLKLAADLLKELETPFKISGLSANPYLFTTIKVVILSALSGVLSEMLGFKLKLHKIKIK